jgi:hypothetical protein
MSPARYLLRHPALNSVPDVSLPRGNRTHTLQFRC